MSIEDGTSHCEGTMGCGCESISILVDEWVSVPGL